MGSKFSTTAISGYNSGPPSDDGSVSASNQLQWAKHINKIGDPLKTLAETINTKLVTFTDFGSRSVTVSDSTVASDHMKTVEIASTATTGVTISLGDAASMTAGYIVTVKNLSAYSQTIGRVTAGDNINGAAQNLAIPPKGHYTFKVAATASNGYYTMDATIHGHGSDIASAASINLDTATGNLVDVTGATTITSVVLSDGRICVARFTGALTLTHSANLVLPGSANITTAAGDYAVFAGYASGIVRCVHYQALVAAPLAATLGLAKLTSGTVSAAATLDIVMTAYTAYANKLLVYQLIPATDGVQLLFRVSTDGGSTYDAGANTYGYAMAGADDTGASALAGAITTFIALNNLANIGNTAEEGIAGVIKMYQTTSTTLFPKFTFESAFVNSGVGRDLFSQHGAGHRAAAQDTDAVRLLFSSGNIASGAWTLYGWN